jgi:hypothetical protein
MYTIPRINAETENERFIAETSRQYKNYMKIYRMSKSLMPENKPFNWEMSPFAALRTASMIKLGAFKDDSVSHLAEMLLMGTVAGATDLRRHLSACKGADKHTKALALGLLKLEEENIDNLKRFL